jgi:hypothetical protein
MLSTPTPIFSAQWEILTLPKLLRRKPKEFLSSLGLPRQTDGQTRSKIGHFPQSPDGVTSTGECWRKAAATGKVRILVIVWNYL